MTRRAWLPVSALLAVWSLCVLVGSSAETAVRAAIPEAPLHRDLLAGTLAGGRRAISRWYYVQACAALQKQDWKSAQWDYLLALEMCPDSAGDWLSASLMLKSSGMISAAAAVASKGFMQTHDDDLGAFWGFLYFQHGDLVRAERVYRYAGRFPACIKCRAMVEIIRQKRLHAGMPVLPER
jgi:hypothetical protein